MKKTNLMFATLLQNSREKLFCPTFVKETLAYSLPHPPSSASAMNMPKPPTPVHLVTGFLGAGKTSFLNHWLRSYPEERIMVIENEVGAINLDSQWLKGTVAPPVELTAGCLCCSLNQELIGLLEGLSQRRDEFDRLVIETTGVADPESLALPFLTIPALERHFTLENVLCLVDAGNIEHWLAEADEARRQVAFASALLVNKVDTLPPAQVEPLVQWLGTVNPQARVWTGEQGQFPVAELRELSGFDHEQAPPLFRQLPGEQAQRHGISTFTLTFDRPFDLRGLSQALMQLLTVNRHQIYRIKGILNAGDYPVQVVLQSVYQTFVLTDGQPWPPDAPRQSQVVVIGKELKKEAIQKVFARYLSEKPLKKPL